MALSDDIASSLDPYLGLTTQATLSALLGADPSRLAMGSDPLGQTFGQLSGQFERGRAASLADQLAGLRQPSVPFISRALASPDAANYVAQNIEGAPAYGVARLLGQMTPSTVAQTRLQAQQAALTGAEAQYWQQRLGPTAATTIPRPGGGSAAAPGGAVGASGLPSSPYYPKPAAAAPAGAEAEPDLTTMSEEQFRVAAANAKTPAQKLAVARAWQARAAAARTAPAPAPLPPAGAAP